MCSTIPPCRFWSDPWTKYKTENDAKIRTVLGDKTLVENIKLTMRSSSTIDPVKDNTFFMFGKTHKDLHSSIRPVEAGGLTSCIGWQRLKRL